MEDAQKTITLVEKGYCDHDWREAYATFTYSNGILIGRECPHNGCSRAKYCKLWNADPIRDRREVDK